MVTIAVKILASRLTGNISPVYTIRITRLKGKVLTARRANLDIAESVKCIIAAFAGKTTITYLQIIAGAAGARRAVIAAGTFATGGIALPIGITIAGTITTGALSTRAMTATRISRPALAGNCARRTGIATDTSIAGSSRPMTRTSTGASAVLLTGTVTTTGISRPAGTGSLTI